MRKFKLIYSDKTMSLKERYEVRRELLREEAEGLAKALETMGCTDFEYVPVERVAAA